MGRYYLVYRPVRRPTVYRGVMQVRSVLLDYLLYVLNLRHLIFGVARKIRE